MLSTSVKVVRPADNRGLSLKKVHDHSGFALGISDNPGPTKTSGLGLILCSPEYILVYSTVLYDRLNLPRPWNLVPIGKLMRKIIKAAIPLALSTSAITICQFFDVLFLSWYSLEAVAASYPAFLIFWSVLMIFFSSARYINTFISQLSGSRRDHEIGTVLFQGLYIALFGAIFMCFFSWLSPNIFMLLGHPEEVTILQIEYFQALAYSSFFQISIGAYIGFLLGVGRAYFIMLFSIAINLLNILFDYLLIFGNLGFPELGIRGAGYAVLISYAFGFFLYSLVVFSKSNRIKYNISKNIRLSRSTLSSLFYYGIPSALEEFLDDLTWTILVIFSGTLGTLALASTNIAISLFTLVAMPLVGVSEAVRVAVAKHIGSMEISLVKVAVQDAVKISLIYTIPLALFFLFTPQLILFFHTLQGEININSDTYDTITTVLKIVALCALLESLYSIFYGALSGAGDTRRPAVVMFLSCFFVFIPLLIFVKKLPEGGEVAVWIAIAVHLGLVAFYGMYRFLSNKWQHVRLLDRL